MTLEETMAELRNYGDPQTKKTHKRHGAKEPLFGVKVQDLKKILKKTKKNYELSLALYETGNSDAMYLAGLMADESKMTKAQLDAWVQNAYWTYLSEYTVPWVAAETPFAIELGLKWIQSSEETIAAAGWSTLASYVTVGSDEKIDLDLYHKLLDQIADTIGSVKNRVRYTMNGFIITVGTYVAPLTEKAKTTGKKVGLVTVDMEGTACKVPNAVDYIQKAIDKNRIGKKRKTARC